MTAIVGLSGGIGSGKSTVARLFEKLGAVLIDSDAIVHELQAPGAPMLEQIARAFGRDLIDATGAPPLRDVSVLIDGDRIKAIGPRGSIPTHDGHLVKSTTNQSSTHSSALPRISYRP